MYNRRRSALGLVYLCSLSGSTVFCYYLLGDDTVAPSGLYARLCHEFLVVYKLSSNIAKCGRCEDGDGVAQLQGPTSEDGRQRRRRSSQVALDALNCFAGGVFLATSLLHMLPDVRHHLHSATTTLADAGFVIHEQFPMAEFLTSVGFFLVLVLEEVGKAGDTWAINDARQGRRRSFSTATVGRHRWQCVTGLSRMHSCYIRLFSRASRMLVARRDLSSHVSVRP